MQYKDQITKLLLLSTLTGGVARAAEADSGKTLYGNVSHSASLEHVSKSLAQHRSKVQALIPETPTLDTEKVPKPTAQKGSLSLTESKAYLPVNGIAQPINDKPKALSATIQKHSIEWFQIPAWMAGKWEKLGDLTVKLIDLKSGEETYPRIWMDNKLTYTWGHQKDGQGNVWHVNFLPSEHDGQSDGKKVRFLTTTQQCEKSDKFSLITRTQYLVSESNFWTGEPLEMFQQESLNHYSATGGAEIVNNSTNRVFSYEGKAIRDGVLESHLNKVGDFTATENINGINLKESLNDYLEEHDLDHLKVKN
ncbi:MAG: hypothetical protein K2X27_21300 [Candidatus Obscuribacterales bacterium]|nr:hypothetical protein [Candidatus Obscuribacterales bacterium]